MHQVRDVEHWQHLAGAEDRSAGNIAHARQLLPQAFHQDLLFVENLVDEKSNLLTRPGKNQHGYLAFRIGVGAGLSNFQDITQANRRSCAAVDLNGLPVFRALDFVPAHPAHSLYITSSKHKQTLPHTNQNASKSGESKWQNESKLRADALLMFNRNRSAHPFRFFANNRQPKTAA